jgi:hypothetical protein
MTGDQWFQMLLAFLPSVVVFLTAFYLIRNMLSARAQERNADWLAQIKKEDHKHALPLRLQAYERLTLFLERISPGGLVLRVHKSNMSSQILHGELLATIREEYEHNVTQQIYVSDKAWAQVKAAKEETLRIINIAAEQAGANSSGTHLSQKIFETASRLSHLPTQQAIITLREEVRKMF